jgi:probable F420-dependent oxidoreductase
MVMKIGIAPVNVGPDVHAFARIAEKAESVGVESVWTFEHVMVPLAYESTYPYHRSGKMPVKPETNFVDPFLALAHIAATTRTVRLGTGVSILPQASPLLFAKQAASLDALSGGRLLLGVGAGWLREEFAAMGVPFARRGARFDDYLTALKKVWAGAVVEHESEFISWSGFKSYPLPAQRPHPPLLIGGISKAALRRVVSHGDGWFAPTEGVDQMGKLLGDLRGHAAAAGRDLGTIELSALWLYRKEGAASLSAYRDLGVSRLVIPLHQLGDDDPIVGLDRLADDLLSKL